MAFHPSSENKVSDLLHAPPEPEIRYLAGFLDAADASAFHESLMSELSLGPDHFMAWGRAMETKRFIDFRGDEGIKYRYSGGEHTAKPWTPTLRAILEMVERECSTTFNSCLCNHYKDGSVGMGWHSDDEPELGRNPTIASISLGETRLFRLRRRAPWREPKTYEKWNLELRNGDLLIMSGSTQRFFEHELPQRSTVSGPRMNLTFRKIVAKS